MGGCLGANEVRIAIIGSGVSGLVCAHMLRPQHEATLFEADARADGHAHIVTTQIDGATHAIDTGFIVYNERNYPIVIRLFAELGVSTYPSDMNFATADDAEDIKMCDPSLRGVFAQGRNLVRPASLGMLADIVRFNRSARRMLREHENLGCTLEKFLALGQYSRKFIEWYLVPMGAAIGSTVPTDYVQFPAAAKVSCG
jgi:hypothetical protein